MSEFKFVVCFLGFSSFLFIANVQAQSPLSMVMEGDAEVQGSIRFPTIATPAMYIYTSGTFNPLRTMIAHSPGYPGYGLFYQDDGDRFLIQSSATDSTPSLVVDLDSNWVTIATPLPKPGYELSVSGQVVATSFLVQDPGNWLTSGDFVSFSPSGVGVNVAEPTHPFEHSSGARLTAGGAWVNGSDRALKANFKPIDPLALLELVLSLPLSEWNYRSEGALVRHLGPMAQDFHATFGLGEDEKSIATVDADGVALGAIQGLNLKIEALTAENAELMERLERLESVLLDQN